MKTRYLILVLFICSRAIQAQLYQGPAQGTSAVGVLVNTGSFIESAVSSPNEKKVFNKFTHKEEVQILPQLATEKVINQIYVEDGSVTNPMDTTAKPLILSSFNGIVETNSIPPDPYIAVGPNHVLSQVNTSFAISDKNGNRLKTIDATTWYHSALTVAGPFDPKVIYDHYANRWVMVWLDQDNATQRGNLLISVSDDDNPMGAWYNWAVPSSVNGTTAANNWSDYQGVGYDKDAIYITTNQFDFNTAGSTFQYSKVRIIPKAQLYANTGEAFKFFDIWDIRNPLSLGSKIFSLRPSRSYTNGTEYYLVHLPSGSSNGVYLYKLKDVTTSPSMTGSAIGIRTYSSTQTANQLGGGSPALEAGGASLRNEPIHKDDRLYCVHAVNNPVNPGYSALHYMQLNLTTNTAVEDYIYGANKYYFIYPALAVDKNNNVALTYSRSGDSSYAGAYFTAKLAGTTAFIPSVPMQHGKANYVKTFGGTRNRWGDYSGMWLDPANQMSIWAFSEYVSAANTWGTWTSEFRLEPFTGQKLVSSSTALQFKPTEVGKNSDTLKVIISNYGATAVQLDSIVTKTKNFALSASVSLPRLVNSYDSITVSVVLKPLAAGVFTDTLKFYNSDPAFANIPISAKGYVIVSAVEKKMYGVSAAGQLVSVEKTNGTGAVIGASNYPTVIGLAVHPKTKVLYGLRNDDGGIGELLRFNAQSGEAFYHYTLPDKNFTAIAFDTAGVFYTATRQGIISRFDLATGTSVRMDSCKTLLASIAFNPKTNALWGSAYKVLGAGKDRVFKINLATGDTTLVGATGFATVNNAIVFDEFGNLFGIKGSLTAAGDLIKIDTTNGVGTVVGSTGITGMTALGYYGKDYTSVTRQIDNRPAAFSLGQNYPNPFNPETIIQYALANESFVTLNVYNVLGERVAVLENTMKAAGTYAVRFDVRKNGGLSSGIYFYEVIAEHANGTYREIKKMNILK